MDIDNNIINIMVIWYLCPRSKLKPLCSIGTLGTLGAEDNNRLLLMSFLIKFCKSYQERDYEIRKDLLESTSKRTSTFDYSIMVKVSNTYQTYDNSEVAYYIRCNMM